MMNIIDLEEKLSQFDEYWSPKIVGELNGQLVKLAKLKGLRVEHRTTDDERGM